MKIEINETQLFLIFGLFAAMLVITGLSIGGIIGFYDGLEAASQIMGVCK